MKKILLTCAIVLSATLGHAQLFPNGDFEDTVANGALPQWTQFSGTSSTPSSITVNNGQGGQEVLRANGGKRFLLMANSTAVGVIATKKFALNTRPNTIRMQACYFPNGSDAFTVVIYFTKDTGGVNQPDTILYGAASLAGARYPWQDVRINIADAYQKAGNPDSAFVVFIAGNNQNSALLIDDVKFSSWTSSVNGAENHFHGTVQIYPNPVLATTAIKYQLNSEANVRLDIYDMQGKLVKTVFEGRETYGLYDKEIDMTELNSGMYVCRLIADDQVNVYKLIKN